MPTNNRKRQTLARLDARASRKGQHAHDTRIHVAVNELCEGERRPIMEDPSPRPHAHVKPRCGCEKSPRIRRRGRCARAESRAAVHPLHMSLVSSVFRRLPPLSHLLEARVACRNPLTRPWRCGCTRGSCRDPSALPSRPRSTRRRTTGALAAPPRPRCPASALPRV